MTKSDKKFQGVFSKIPAGLPLHLNNLTAAGHLHAAGYAVDEHSFESEGMPSCATILTPIMISDDESGEYDSHIMAMYEVRANALLTIQQAANLCGVGYRTIQRWRDEKKISYLTLSDGKQLFPSEMLKDYATNHGRLRR